MTDKEKAIVMAYTGVCMLSGDKLKIFYEYVENIMGRPVYTHEMVIKAIDNEIKEKAKADFIALCAEQESKTEKIIKMRDATPEEQEAIDKYIKSISKPTGVNVFDFYEDEKQEQIDFVQLKKKIPCTIKVQADGEKTCVTCRNNDTYHCVDCENKSDWEDCNEFYNWDAPIRKQEEEEKNCDNCGKLKYHCQECGVNLDNWTPKQTDKIKAQTEVNAHAIQSALDNGTNTVIGTAQADNIPVMYYPQVDGITPTVVAQADGNISHNRQEMR